MLLKIRIVFGLPLLFGLGRTPDTPLPFDGSKELVALEEKLLVGRLLR